MDDDLLQLINKIKAKRKEDGYIVEYKSSNKNTLEEIIANIIKTHI